MAKGIGITGATPATNGAAVSSPKGGIPSDPAVKRPPAAGTGASGTTPPGSSIPGTSYSAVPVETQAPSRLVARLVSQNATVFGPGLAKVQLESRPIGETKPAARKPAGPFTFPRELAMGQSPIAPMSLWDARRSIVTLGVTPTDTPGIA